MFHEQRALNGCKPPGGSDRAFVNFLARRTIRSNDVHPSVMQNVLANTLEISGVSLLVTISWQIDLNSHRQADIAITTIVFGIASLLAGFLYHYIFLRSSL